MFNNPAATVTLKLPIAPSTGLAVVHVALHSAGELTKLVAETHVTIFRLPWLWPRDISADSEHAPRPYQLIIQTFAFLAQQSLRLLRKASAPAVQSGQIFYGVLNGVCGDKLQAWESPLAQRMLLCDENGNALRDDWIEGHPDVVILIHGLCGSERWWSNPAHAGFVTWLRQRNHAVAWLRCNSGLPIHENGRLLNDLLENTFSASTMPRLTLIGHSMGGLIMRSAAHQATVAGSRWVQSLRQAAYLGTPHLGSPLERWGYAFNNALGLTPYSKPFMRLGNIRSQGIRDLRYGRVLSEDTGDVSVPLLPAVRHLFLAGHLNPGTKRHWIGDGTVRVHSALALHVNGDQALSGPDVTRCELTAVNHIALLRDERVYQALRQWMND